MGSMNDDDDDDNDDDVAVVDIVAASPHLSNGKRGRQRKGGDNQHLKYNRPRMNRLVSK